jgi:amidophosphoribosyltransferase
MSGVVGLYSIGGENISDRLFYSLCGLQHRGEEGCGLSVNRGNDGFYTPIPGEGLVHYRLKSELPALRELSPVAGIGHTLYENTGSSQPVEQSGINHRLSMAMDGILLGFHGKNDAYMRTLFSRCIESEGDFFKAGEKLMQRLHRRGSYCVVTLVENDDGLHLVYFRDPRGIKPYCLGRLKNDTFIVASESKALDVVEADFVKDIEPGEMGVINKKGHNERVLASDDHAHCAFEHIYFASQVSTIEGRNVYMVRKALGRKLAQRYGSDIEVDLVMASPDSGRGVAVGFQQGLCEMQGRFVPFEEGAEKNPGARRTFQINNPEERLLALGTKFFINKDVVNGKAVAVGDDSIVKGGVFRDGMARKLYKAGASKVIAVISCPPLRFPCIKDPQGTEQFAAQGMTGAIEDVGKRVAEKIGVDMVCYPTIKEMVDAVGLSDLGMACFDGVYPVDTELLK